MLHFTLVKSKSFHLQWRLQLPISRIQGMRSYSTISERDGLGMQQLLSGINPTQWGENKQEEEEEEEEEEKTANEICHRDTTRTVHHITKQDPTKVRDI